MFSYVCALKENILLDKLKCQFFFSQHPATEIMPSQHFWLCQERDLVPTLEILLKIMLMCFSLQMLTHKNWWLVTFIGLLMLNKNTNPRRRTRTRMLFMIYRFIPHYVFDCFVLWVTKSIENTFLYISWNKYSTLEMWLSTYK